MSWTARNLAARQREHRKQRNKAIAGGLAVTLAIAGFVGIGIARVNHVETHASCTIEEKDSREVAALTKKSVRVYTDCGVFVVRDEAWAFHFSSADVYGDLQVGETVDLKAIGWRVPLFSWFPNVVEVTE